MLSDGRRTAQEHCAEVQEAVKGCVPLLMRGFPRQATLVHTGAPSRFHGQLPSKACSGSYQSSTATVTQVSLVQSAPRQPEEALAAAILIGQPAARAQHTSAAAFVCCCKDIFCNCVVRHQLRASVLYRRNAPAMAPWQYCARTRNGVMAHSRRSLLPAWH